MNIMKLLCLLVASITVVHCYGRGYRGRFGPFGPLQVHDASSKANDDRVLKGKALDEVQGLIDKAAAQFEKRTRNALNALATEDQEIFMSVMEEQQAQIEDLIKAVEQCSGGGNGMVEKVKTECKCAPEIIELKPAIVEPEPAILEPMPEPFEPKPQILEPKPEIFEPLPDIIELIPEILEPIPESLDVKPEFPDPSSESIEAKPAFQLPKDWLRTVMGW